MEHELMTPEDQGQDAGQLNAAGEPVILPHLSYAQPASSSIGPEDEDPAIMTDWTSESPKQFVDVISSERGEHPLPESVKAWMTARPAVEAYERDHPFIETEEQLLWV